MGIVQEKYEIIIQILSKDNNQLNIKWLCDVAGVSRSGFYAYKNRKVNLSKKEIQDREYTDFKLSWSETKRFEKLYTAYIRELKYRVKAGE